MQTIKSLPIHLRPHEKLLDRGASTLTTAELLAILIRTGRAGHSALSIAESIIKKVSQPEQKNQRRPNVRIFLLTPAIFSGSRP